MILSTKNVNNDIADSQTILFPNNAQTKTDCSHVWDNKETRPLHKDKRKNLKFLS